MSNNHISRITSYQSEVYDVIKAEAARRRNGGKGFSLTLNQIVLEWLDAYNAGILPMDTRALQEMPAVEKVLAVATKAKA
jgi:hypothetical protein